MRMHKNMVKILAIVVFSLIAVVMIGSECNADSKWYKRYDACLNASGGRSNIESVKQACRWAAEDNVNGCSLWIGPANSSTVPEITVYSETGTASIMYWGLCTDRVDRTSQVYVDNDNGAINDAMNVTRQVMPNVGGKQTTLDIAKFIAGASKQRINQCETVYTMKVVVGRYHSDGRTEASMEQPVKLRVISGVNCNRGNTCNDWKPASYVASNAYSGVTSIDERIKNLAGRFGGNGFGAWNDNDIYAMPTDTISWMACYYPGVQKTAKTQVGSLNGQDYGYDIKPWELPTDRCLHYYVEVKYELLYVKANKISEWQNKFKMYGDAGSWEGGPWATGDSTIRSHTMEKTTAEGDAGKTFTETAETGKPISAVIDQHKPATDNRHCTCEKWICDRAGWHDTSYTDALGYHPSGYWDSSKSYCAASHYEFATCSCCTEDWGDGFATQKSAGPTDKTGHLNTYTKNLNDATVNFSTTQDSLSVRLPYNFTTSTDLSINKTMVYSGDEDQIMVSEVTTSVYTRYNAVTIADYATQVPNAGVRLFAYVSASSDGGGIDEMLDGSGDLCAALGEDAKQCLKLKEATGLTLNSGGSLGGRRGERIWENESLIYNAFDASAGDYMCFASAVSPYSVSGDTDMNGGDGLWIYSEPKCAIIAKRPIFQVWGGSLYSVGSIDTAYNKKVNIYNQYSDDVQNQWKQRGGASVNFLPWVEEALVIRDGSTLTVSSGAGSALNPDVRVGVGTNKDLCKGRANLSFANYSQTISELCGASNIVGKSGIDSGISDREELIDYWLGTNAGSYPNTGGTSYTLNGSSGSEITTATGVKMRYIKSGDLTLNGSTVPQGVTYLIKSTGTVTISGNIRYNTGSYSTFGSIPKVLIYANNVNIRCGVSEVDAVIVTARGGTVNTCSEFADNTSSLNDSRRSNRLKIFGMVITDKIILGRTYGAAANENDRRDPDGIPSDGAAAEVFDYDSSVLIWSEYMAGSAETDTLQTVYQHELAPRY